MPRLGRWNGVSGMVEGLDRDTIRRQEAIEEVLRDQGYAVDAAAAFEHSTEFRDRRLAAAAPPLP